VRQMSQIYFNMPGKQLRTLRSKKYNKTLRMKKETLSWFGERELRRLEEQIRWIDAVLASREYQEKLL